jgi:hypothetical protein
MIWYGIYSVDLYSTCMHVTSLFISLKTIHMLGSPSTWQNFSWVSRPWASKNSYDFNSPIFDEP